MEKRTITNIFNTEAVYDILIHRKELIKDLADNNKSFVKMRIKIFFVGWDVGQRLRIIYLVNIIVVIISLFLSTMEKIFIKIMIFETSIS